MTRRKSWFLVKIYIFYVVSGFLFLNLLAFIILVFTERGSVWDEAFSVVGNLYLLGIALLFPLIMPQFFSFCLFKVNIRRTDEKRYRALINSPLRFIIWDEIKLDHPVAEKENAINL